MPPALSPPSPAGMLKISTDSTHSIPTDERSQNHSGLRFPAPEAGNLSTAHRVPVDKFYFVHHPCLMGVSLSPGAFDKEHNHGKEFQPSQKHAE